MDFGDFKFLKLKPCTCIIVFTCLIIYTFKLRLSPFFSTQFTVQ